MWLLPWGLWAAWKPASSIVEAGGTPPYQSGKIAPMAPVDPHPTWGTRGLARGLALKLANPAAFVTTIIMYMCMDPSMATIR